MLEMGKYSQQEHQRIYDLAKSKKPKCIVLVGNEFGKIALAAGDKHFDIVEDAKEWWKKQNIENAYVLIKGSRGIQLEKVISV